MGVYIIYIWGYWTPIIAHEEGVGTPCVSVSEDMGREVVALFFKIDGGLYYKTALRKARV